eukprot:Seg1882.3 transcript_id=Seg1882.3/GoldUCD/mRNA.D3Y31 product="NAD-dependent protein deacetylase sirtuin-2" protein_id=Seg1882.3/GoldUCD/D3Y31
MEASAKDEEPQIAAAKGEEEGNKNGDSNDKPNRNQENDKSGGEDKPEDYKEEEGTSGASMMDLLVQHLQSRLGLSLTDEEKEDPVLEEFTLAGIAKYMKSDKCKNIVVMTGAGISTSAGIPDFRSPGTGLYHNLEKYNLPTPQSIFELNYFKENPEPFFMLARELFPGNYKPTPSHYFLRLLAEKKMMIRNYTQNIDGLEIVAGVSPELVVAAHGTFHSCHCLGCREEYSQEWAKERIFKGEVPKCEECGEVVKPDIVFFGEALPSRFFTSTSLDFPKCGLLIVMGTSLVVQPFASLIDRVHKSTPRLLINKEKCGQGGFFGGFDFDSDRKYRDVAHLTTCDEGCLELADLLGWKDELETLIKEEHKKFDEAAKESQSTSSSQAATSGGDTSQQIKDEKNKL